MTVRKRDDGEGAMAGEAVDRLWAASRPESRDLVDRRARLFESSRIRSGMTNLVNF